jgi:hypothetical protein
MTAPLDDQRVRLAIAARAVSSIVDAGEEDVFDVALTALTIANDECIAPAWKRLTADQDDALAALLERNKAAEALRYVAEQERDKARVTADGLSDTLVLRDVQIAELRHLLALAEQRIAAVRVLCVNADLYHADDPDSVEGGAAWMRLADDEPADNAGRNVLPPVLAVAVSDVLTILDKGKG